MQSTRSSAHSHRARSTGFIWRPGLIVTAAEALAEEGEVHVTTFGGDKVRAQMVGRSIVVRVHLACAVRSRISRRRFQLAIATGQHHSKAAERNDDIDRAKRRHPGKFRPDDIQSRRSK